MLLEAIPLDLDECAVCTIASRELDPPIRDGGEADARRT
jgi:hypothetical protein